MEECPKCKDRGTVYRDGKTEWCDCTVGQVLRGSLKKVVGQAKRARPRKRKPTERIPTEALENWLPTFFGLELKSWKDYQEGFLLDFGDRGILFRGKRILPEIADRMVGQVLTDWEPIDGGIILNFGKTGLIFEAPLELEPRRRREWTQ